MATSKELHQLEQLWSHVQSVEPGAVEGLSYGLPALKLESRPLIGFGLHSDFMSVYPYSPKIISALHQELEEFETARGTVRFTSGNPLPLSVVELIIDFRKAELANNSYKKKKSGIEIELRDPIYDVMSEKEIDEASDRFPGLLKDE